MNSKKKKNYAENIFNLSDWQKSKSLITQLAKIWETVLLLIAGVVQIGIIPTEVTKQYLWHHYLSEFNQRYTVCMYKMIYAQVVNSSIVYNRKILKTTKMPITR